MYYRLVSVAKFETSEKHGLVCGRRSEQAPRSDLAEAPCEPTIPRKSGVVEQEPTDIIVKDAN